MINRLFKGIEPIFWAGDKYSLENCAGAAVLLAWARILWEWLLLSSMVAYLALTEMGAQLYIVTA